VLYATNLILTDIVCLVINSRGILTYVRKDVKCTQIFPNIGFSECLTLELEDDEHHKLNIATIYRSPNSTIENDMKIIEYIDILSAKMVINL